MKKMSKLLIIFLFFVIFITGCKGVNDKNKSFTEISSFKEFKELFKSYDINVIVIGQTTCSHCISYEKTVSKVVRDHDINIYWIEFDLLSTKEKEEFKNFNKRFESFGTPLTIFTKNNEIIDELVGNVGEKFLTDKLQMYNKI